MKQNWIVFIALLLQASTSLADWEVWENCSLAKDGYHDGDSFKVTKEGGTYEFILRLYYVDTPETDASLEDRVKDQAEYWGITEKEVLRLGDDAKKFTEKYLKKEFTVYTQKHKAMGRSKKNRYYALIETDEGLLGEALVRNGLARIYGVDTEMPDHLPNRGRYEFKLKSAEREAKKNGYGGWGGKPVEQKKVKTLPQPSLFSTSIADLPESLVVRSGLNVYSAKSPHGLVGRLTSGMDVKILRAENNIMIRIQFETQSGKRYEALARTDDLLRESRL